MIRKRRKKKEGDFRLRLPNIEMSDSARRDILGIFLFALGAISILSFLSLAGTLGYDINKGIRILFGYGFVFFPLLLFFWGAKIVKSEDIFKSQSYFFGLLLFVMSVLSIFHIFYNPDLMFETAKSGRGGGLLGASLAWVLVTLVGKWGAFVLALSLLLAATVFTFEISLSEIVAFLKPPKIEKPKAKGVQKNDKEGDLADGQIEHKERKGLLYSLGGKLKSKEPKVSDEGTVAPVFSVKPIGDDSSDIAIGGDNPKGEDRTDENFSSEEDVYAPIKDSDGHKVNKIMTNSGNWKLPPIDLLNGSDSEPTSGDIQANSNIIQRTLANFGIQVEMGEVNVGPTVTQYTLKPLVGVKLSRITALQNDLALALAARTLRIEAPIPGKSWVGIELPNETVAMVTLKNVLESLEFKGRKSNLSMILGRDVAGNSVIANIAKMPHLMIAGSTGSGKTVCINTLITGLLFQNSPSDLKFIMIDPKRVELTPYNDIPHLLTPVITDPEKAINSLKWAVKEMENRYDMLSAFGCRNIESYNDAVRAKYKDREPLHYIIIVIDEMADLMATHGREMEAVVVRLAQMARAIGIHLVLSTQRPSVEVITGLIKANVTTRIAFCVASQIDSRTILDSSGAEKLLGNGDMLYIASDANKPKRIQGVFISEEEVHDVVEFIKSQKEEENDYNSEIVESKKFASDPMGENNEVDDNLYNEALEVVRSAGKASASLLQRRLRVGYARAARLLDLMEDQGAVGPAQGAKPREVYLDGVMEGSVDTEEEQEDSEI
ncbi:MAG: DNA translocase FtsK 4TM domain-containing protein [Candidatus Pacebacteria bacterium]|nr:DNA translocase FtsK 4TM domain-containing protein [Candidatus Paceibacterota bacterium]